MPGFSCLWKLPDKPNPGLPPTKVLPLCLPALAQEVAAPPSSGIDQASALALTTHPAVFQFSHWLKVWIGAPAPQTYESQI